MKDLSLIEPNLVNLIMESLCMLLGEVDKDFYFYEIDSEVISLRNWLHRN